MIGNNAADTVFNRNLKVRRLRRLLGKRPPSSEPPLRVRAQQKNNLSTPYLDRASPESTAS